MNLEIPISQMHNAYIVDIVRTPIGKFGGALSSVRPDDLAAIVLAELMKRYPQIPGTAVEDVILGAANQAGEDNRNVARMALLLSHPSLFETSLACHDCHSSRPGPAHVTELVCEGSSHDD